MTPALACRMRMPARYHATFPSITFYRIVKNDVHRNGIAAFLDAPILDIMLYHVRRLEVPARDEVRDRFACQFV